MKASRVLVSLVVLITLCAAAAVAQDTAQITGTVQDPSGAVVSGAQVTVVGAGIGVTRVTTTNAEGSYLAAGLPAGTYDLSVTAQGFKSFQARQIVVQVAEKARIEVK